MKKNLSCIVLLLVAYHQKSCANCIVKIFADTGPNVCVRVECPDGTRHQVWPGGNLCISVPHDQVFYITTGTHNDDGSYIRYRVTLKTPTVSDLLKSLEYSITIHLCALLLGMERPDPLQITLQRMDEVMAAQPPLKKRRMQEMVSSS